MSKTRCEQIIHDLEIFIFEHQSTCGS